MYVCVYCTCLWLMRYPLARSHYFCCLAVSCVPAVLEFLQNSKSRVQTCTHKESSGAAILFDMEMSRLIYLSPLKLEVQINAHKESSDDHPNSSTSNSEVQMHAHRESSSAAIFLI